MALVIAGLLLVCVLVGTGLAALADTGPFHDEPVDCGEYRFDPDRWEDKSSRTDEARALVRCRTLVGLDKRDVRSRLGAESFANHLGGDYLYYLLYSDIDDTHLVVSFDNGGRVARADIETG